MRRGGAPRDAGTRTFAALVESLLAEGREVCFTARGASMAPFIRDGETVLVRPAPGRPRRGDVLLCRGAAGELLLHRVVRLHGEHVVTRGDAHATEDPPLPRSHVLGRAVAVAGRRRLHLRFPFGVLPAVLPRRILRAAARLLPARARRRGDARAGVGSTCRTPERGR